MLATFETVLILGIHPGITLEDLHIKGIIRVEFLMSSEVKMPGIQNVSENYSMCFKFIIDG